MGDMEGDFRVSGITKEVRKFEMFVSLFVLRETSLDFLEHMVCYSG